MESRVPPEHAAVNALAPFVHVADVLLTMRFYEQLGFVSEDTMALEGVTFWGSMRSGAARIMFARADPLVEPEMQGVFFYMYSKDVITLREHLITRGLRESTDTMGEVVPEETGVIFPIAYPDHMPAGELRVHDPDGYCVLIGQKD
ncbi:MAG: hypothetical protein IPJ19_04710 [Planctomycetes bacterium]|nr:hypothetical protein [Planctomycetota bacterium]